MFKFLDNIIPLEDGEEVKMSTKTRGPCVGGCDDLDLRSKIWNSDELRCGGRGPAMVAGVLPLQRLLPIRVHFYSAFI